MMNVLGVRDERSPDGDVEAKPTKELDNQWQTDISKDQDFLKGAIIQFSAPLLVPIPNIIIFQYNTESKCRLLSRSEPLDEAKH